MDELIVDVNIWGNNVGALIWDHDNEAASFQYDDKFLRSGLDVSPVMMPLRSSAGMVYQF